VNLEIRKMAGIKKSKKVLKKDRVKQSLKSKKKKILNKKTEKHKEKAPKKQIVKLSGQKKFFYDLLMELRARIMGQVKILEEEALTTGAEKGEHSSAMANHLADYGSDNFLHNMELDIITGEMEDIEMIDEAIERLMNGEYGICLDCGCKIPIERLKIKPHARFCVRCKEKYEAEAKKIVER